MEYGLYCNIQLKSPTSNMHTHKYVSLCMAVLFCACMIETPSPGILVGS